MYFITSCKKGRGYSDYVILILLEINVSPGINPTLQPCSSCLASHESEIYFICISVFPVYFLYNYRQCRNSFFWWEQFHKLHQCLQSIPYSYWTSTDHCCLIFVYNYPISLLVRKQCFIHQHYHRSWDV